MRTEATEERLQGPYRSKTKNTQKGGVMSQTRIVNIELSKVQARYLRRTLKDQPVFETSKAAKDRCSQIVARVDKALTGQDAT